MGSQIQYHTLSCRLVRCGGTNRRRLSTSPSDPKASPLYGLVADYFDEFERVYEERFADKHGFGRPFVGKVADRFLDCGDLCHGFARIRCENPDCRQEMILAFSCRGRNICPSCHAKRVAAFADWMAAEVLADMPHSHAISRSTTPPLHGLVLQQK